MISLVATAVTLDKKMTHEEELAGYQNQEMILMIPKNIDMIFCENAKAHVWKTIII
jgi:hypothetical protein